MLRLIEQAAEEGIILYVEDEQLRFRQVGDKFPEELKETIKVEKQNIIEFLTQQQNQEKQLGLSNIVQLLLQQASDNPEKTALVFEGKSLSFGDFAHQIEVLASYIAAHSQGKPVALLLGRGINAMVAIYAALRACVTYVPIDPANPDERIVFYLNDCEAELLITEPQHMGKGNLFSGTAVCVSDVLAEASQIDSTLPDLSQTAAELPAYIIYTSGSTGEPKGVICTHDNLIHFNQAMLQQYRELELDADAKWLWNASYAFDASVKGIVSLAQGKTNVVPNDIDVKDPASIIRLINEQQISVVNTPPLVMEYLLPHLEATKTRVHLMVSGDDVSPQLWSKLHDYRLLNQRKVINAYGPTEATVNASFELQDNNVEVSIGSAVEGTQLLVLNDAGNEVAEGEEGELYIAGNGVAAGYLNRQDATQANFVHLSQFNVRAFKSGDIVRVLSGGKLQFVGRVDDQVKYRGYRVELDEIRSVLKAHEAVAEVAVIANKEATDLRIEAYLTAQGEAPSQEILNSWLNDYLPEYMHPTRLVMVDEIPLTSGGKVNKVQLLQSQSVGEIATVKAGSDITSRLTAIWSQILKVSDLKPEDNFFHLGGYSLLAMQLLRSIDEEFGVVMEIRDLFSLLTLQSQIDWITENSTEQKLDLDVIDSDDLVAGADEKVELEL